MTLMIMEGEGNLNTVELDFFLKGNISLSNVRRKNPFTWITANGWKDLERLEELSDDWKAFKVSLEDKEMEWKDWYDLDAPEGETLPCGFEDKFSPF